ncbi:MAG TPA: hypothetical protein VJO34_08825 [Methylomirabilota bacterium]|nr:hypothetical protein [Methylomirabilota bacterium]
MRAFRRVGLVLIIGILWAIGISEAQDGLTKRDAQGPVTVAVTLLAAPSLGEPLKAKVVLDTHSVSLDGIKFEEAFALRTPDGVEAPPVAVEQATGSGHHRTAVLVFSAPTKAGAVNIVSKNIGGVAERSFSWELSGGR